MMKYLVSAEVSLRYSIILLFGITLAQAQSHEIGARESALGDCSLFSTGVFSSLNMPAAMVESKSGVGVYGARPFMLPGVNESWAAAFGKVPGGSIGAWAGVIGNKYFRQSSLGLAFGKSLSSRLDMGIHMAYEDSWLSKEKAQATLRGAAGLRFKLNESLWLASQVHKAFNFKGINGGSQLKVGFAYRPAVMLQCFMQYLLDDIQRGKFSLGLEYEALSGVFLRTGFHTTPGTWSLGLGWLKELPRQKTLLVDIASSQHPVLGSSPQISLAYEL